MRRNKILVASLILNFILIVALGAGYQYVQLEKMWCEIDANHWAASASTMHCINDFQNASGVSTASLDQHCFRGQRLHG